MGLVNFKMYDKQKEFIIQFLQDHYVVVNKSRQTGMSTINK
jgi:phosphatidylglycerophosphatase A